jgi:hypothetical protein
MATHQGAQARSPWEQFALRNKLGTGGSNTKNPNKSEKDKTEGNLYNPEKKEAEKGRGAPLAISEPLHTDNGGISYKDSEAFADIMTKKNLTLSDVAV